MQKRTIILGDYDTAAHGWTLAGWELSPAKYRQNFVEVPGMDGPLDLSTVLGGRPVYDTRTLTATLECSEGTRLEREAIIDVMVNRLTGQRMAIVLPDDPLHHITGRVEVAKNYNDPAHAAVTVTAICGPWREAMEETVEFVPLCGKNLFDNQNLVSIIKNHGEATTIDTGVRSTVVQAGTWRYDLLRVLPTKMLAGKTITLSYTAVASAANTPRVCLGYADASGEYRVQEAISLAYADALTLTVDPAHLSEADYVAIWLYANHTGTGNAGDYIDFTNLQLEIGAQATSFDPYTAMGEKEEKEVHLVNDQRRTVCPTVIVQGEVTLGYSAAGGATFQALSTGTYRLPGLQLGTGEQTVSVSGTGAVAFTYRKAGL